MLNKSLLLLLFLYLCCTTTLLAQGDPCPVTISPDVPPPTCGQSVQLQANATGATNYQWLKDNVELTGFTGASYLATESGRYQVRAVMPCGTVTSSPVTVTINPLPARPGFIYNPNTVACSGTPITFTIVDPKDTETYVWDFGDGTTAIGKVLTHTYTAVGAGTRNFPVKVYSRGPGGCNSPTYTESVPVNQVPQFTAPTDSANFNVCIPEDQDTISVTAKLTNTMPATNDIVSYVVDFGDGAGPQTFLPEQFSGSKTISNKIPYDTTGSFPISIRAIGSNGCETVFTQKYQVNKKPTAKFTANKDRVSPPVPPKDCIPVKVTVDSDSTSGGNVTYKWSVKTNTGQPASPGVYQYIEGTSDTSAKPILQFGTPGRYKLELIATNSCGSDTTSQSLLIGYPEIRMNIDTTACGELVIRFRGGEPTVDPNLGTIDETSYEWIITGTGGATAVNGTDLRDRSPWVRFRNPGVYEVRLRVRNECGFSDEVDQPGGVARITINEIPPTPTIASTGTTICAGDSAAISPRGPGRNFAFFTVRDGGRPFFTGPAYTTGALFRTTVYYVATLDEKGCMSQNRARFEVTVLPAIENNSISQAPDQTEVCAGQTIAQPLTGTEARGGGGTLSYQWQSSQTGNPNDFVAAPGPNTGRDYTPPALSQTTWFRRLVLTTNCRPDTSNVLSIRVTAPVANNNINVVSGAGSVICEGQTGPGLTGSDPGSTAVIVWESSTLGASATNFSPAAGINNTPNYTPGVLTQTTWFRRRVTTGGCSVVSAALEITVTPGITNNTIGENQFICSPTSPPAPLIGSVPRGGNGTLTYLWEMSLTGNDSDFGPAPGNNSQANYTPPTLSRTTWFRRTVRSGSCEPVPSNKVELTFVPPVGENTIAATQATVCAGSLPVLTGSPGNADLVFLWESSTTSATTGFNPAPGTNNGRNYTPPFITQNTWYRRTVKVNNTPCPPQPSNVVAITVEPVPAAPTVAAAEVEVCQGASATLRAQGNGGTFEWYTSATGGTPVFYGPEFLTPPLSANTTFYVQFISDNKCVSASRTPVAVRVLSIAADAGRDTTIIEGQTMALRARGGTQYQWYPDAGLSNPNIANPVASPTKTTTYRVQVTNELGCVASDEVTITVIPRVRVVNTFSPNRDGINETWEIEHIERYPNATVEIFNRWGNLVFKSTGAYQPWDGTFKGSQLPLATYYYIIRLDKDEKPISGSVTIIR